MPYEREEDVTKKLTTFLEITVMIIRVLQPSKSRNKPDYRYTGQ